MGIFKGGSGGFLGGAATGAGIGAIGGPWGAAIGAGIGGLAGATGMLGKTGIGGAITGQSEDPLKYEVDPGSRAAFQESPEQKRFLEYLSQQMYGQQTQAPSMAEALLQQKTAENIAATSGAMASARGVYNPAILAREVAKIQAAQGQQANQAGAVLAAQEAQQKQEQVAQRQQQFLAALEANRQSAIDFEKMKAGVGTENVKAQNLARQEANKSQLGFLSGLGQAGATLGAAYISKKS